MNITISITHQHTKKHIDHIWTYTSKDIQ